MTEPGEDIAYTVTFLEMQARPARPRPPASAIKGLSLMRARTPPTHFFRYLYDAVGSGHHWTDMHALSDEEVARFAQHEDVALMVLYLTGWPAGFAMLDRREKPLTDLAYFGLAPEALGRGLGDWLLGTAIHMAWDSSPSRLTVNTCTLDHPRALPLYQKWGFTPIRREQKRRVAADSVKPG